MPTTGGKNVDMKKGAQCGQFNPSPLNRLPLQQLESSLRLY